MYIVRSGKIELYTHRYQGFRKQFKKLLKVIEPKSSVEVSDNIYGYSSVISNRSIRINAVAKDFSCVYIIEKAAFIECVSESKTDLEYYFEIKTRIDES
jgi:signal-transduction protein with cAMP-binding, CBS, and nucleotidyltransferase domain